MLGPISGRAPAVTSAASEVAVPEVAVPSKWKTQERRDREHHWIARSGWVEAPRGCRSPIEFGGGARSRVSDPRDTRLSAGRGCRKPAVAPVDNGETQPLRTPGAVDGPRG